MSELTEKNGPRSDFAKSLDKSVSVRFRNAEYVQQLGLGNECQGRLVGVERFGLWIEPGTAREAALSQGQPVAHYFIPWDEVLTVVRLQEAELFQEKKEYRGLRPS